jgi:hypothetical protein
VAVWWPAAVAGFFLWWWGEAEGRGRSMELFGLRFQFAPYFELDPYVKLTYEPFCIDSSVDGIGWIFGQLEMSGCGEKRGRKEKRGSQRSRWKEIQRGRCHRIDGTLLFVLSLLPPYLQYKSTTTINIVVSFFTIEHTISYPIPIIHQHSNLYRSNPIPKP